MSDFTLAELCQLQDAMLCRAAGKDPAPRASTGDEVLFNKLGAMIAARTPGELVFRLELGIRETELLRKKAGETPRVYAPTLNEYNGAPGWLKAKLRKQTDQAILIAKPRWPHWDMGIEERFKFPGSRAKSRKPRCIRTGGRKRLVIVTRHSTRRPDEASSVDSIGGKIPVDRLVVARILRDDNERWLAREARWVPADPGTGRVVVEVFELSAAVD